MDSTLFLIVLVFCVLVLVGLGYLIMSPSTYKGITQPNENEPIIEDEILNNNRGGGLARMNIRNRRNNQTTTTTTTEIISDESSEEISDDESGVSSSSGMPKKMGTKKMEKLKRKEEKRKNNEALAHFREETKKKQEEDEKLQKQKREEQLEKERLQREEEKRIQEEKERKETEAYNLIKRGMSLEEEGESTLSEQQQNNLLQQFISYLKSHKMVLLEDVAMEFNIKTMDAIERIKSLDKQGLISGVIDDRGKFIYISRDELEQVAKFINKKGRVNIEQIAYESNKLIDLNSKVIEQPTIQEDIIKN
ncbi:hypothetical protein DLAC_08856 [Tieghemostelium lacteum]|uniref:DDRGK domain-containing protein 1 n=1 Tax=Tieghemostelium lacteum TaxID=361077 RepID=A0A151Z8F5_TIELA|nr:hypothetical protein DLAC_08856 [Tieghemostelium lacteum]|eukprot:KYQ90253.1 hypothetical protein DLAC_08856 [Tieghemostelium lacteum]